MSKNDIVPLKLPTKNQISGKHCDGMGWGGGGVGRSEGAVACEAKIGSSTVLRTWQKNMRGAAPVHKRFRRKAKHSSPLVSRLWSKCF